jgi:hypothetical protein
MQGFDLGFPDPAEEAGSGAKTNYGMLIDKQLDRVQFFRSIGSMQGYTLYIDAVSGLFGTVSAYIEEDELAELEKIESEFTKKAKRVEPNSASNSQTQWENLKMVDKQFRSLMMFLRKRGFIPNKRLVDVANRVEDAA